MDNCNLRIYQNFILHGCESNRDGDMILFCGVLGAEEELMADGREEQASLDATDSDKSDSAGPIHESNLISSDL